MKLPFGGEDVTRLTVTPNIPDPEPNTVNYDYALARDRSTYSVSAMPWLPQSPDSDEWAKELYERIDEAERKYIAPNLLFKEYEEGTAEEADEVLVVRSRAETPYLFSAEHATCPVRPSEREYRFPDVGTGGLAAVMAEDYGTAVIMRGRQTTNVPNVVEHPLKDQLRIELPKAAGFLSVHGKAPGMFVHPDDNVEIHACLGLGREPSETTRDFARKVQVAARDELGLYVVISNDQPAYIQKPESTELKRLEDGQPKLSRLAGLGPNMTVNFSRDYLGRIGRDAPSLQIELTNLLRLTPKEGSRKDEKSRIIGVALGYKLLEKVVELTFIENTKSQTVY